MLRDVNRNVKVFGMVICVLFGPIVLLSIAEASIGLFNSILKIDFLVDYRNLSWVELITFIFIGTGLFIAGYDFIKLNNNRGKRLFEIFFPINIVMKILILFKSWHQYPCPLTILGLLVTFVFDMFIIVAFLLIFIRRKKEI